MSTTVDSRVVEMRFDNKHFESNVSTTMSTLDKLKQKLHLDGATKGLENVGSAAKKVDMSGLGAGVDTVQAKFSAMQVVGVTALANITNSAVNAGKRMIKALTLDPITTGFKEYETQINAVQTILANTESKGTTLDQVNAALDELNKYADKTIYNFTEMTRNIGTFTAAGVDLDTSVNAIQGIANLAAVSGSTSQQASTAMYQLSQALASGTVKLMDWNSVVNAGMGGQVFQDALKETARVHGIAIDDMIKNEGSFRETLSKGWLTSEILTETLSKFTMATEGLTEAEIEANKVKLKSLGYTDEQIEGIFKLGNTATNAATKVKTFTQLWDVLKESAQSGWAQTWKLIVGDFEEAKSLLTPLADALTGFINKMSDARNRILQVALDFAKPWVAITDKLGNIKKAITPIEQVIGKLEDFQDIVDRVWMGEFSVSGGDPDRRDLLKAAGYDPRVVQELVNLGEESWHAGKVYKLSMEEVEAAHAKFGLTMKTTKEETKQATTVFERFTDEQLKNAGLTEEEISLYRALESEADRLGISVSELADEMSNTSGRDLLIESFKNIGDIFVGTGKAIKEAWVEIFEPPSLEVFGVRLYGVIKSIKEFTETLRLTDKDTGKLNENGLKLKRTFEGIFAAIDIVLTVVGGPLKIVFKLITQLLSAFGFNILDVTASIGDMLVKLRDFIDGALDFSGVFEKIADPIKKAYKAFQEWIASLKESKNLPQDIAKGIVSGFGKAFTAVKNFFKKIPEYFSNGFDGLKDSPITVFLDKIRSGLGLAGQTIVELGKILLEKLNGFLSAKGMKTISEDSIAGLVNGFKEGAVKAWEAAVQMAKDLVAKVKEFLGIHSPSTVFAAIGGFIIAGLVAGLQNGIPDSLGAIKDVFQPMLDWIKGIDFGAVLAGVIGIGATATAYKGVSGISNMLGGLGEVFAGTGEILMRSAKPIAKVVKNTAKVVKSFSKVLNGIAFSIKVDAIKGLLETVCKSLLMLVAAIAILTFFDPKELWNAVGIVAALAVILVGLAFAMDKLSSATASVGKNGIDVKGLSSGLAGIGIAILLLALTVKTLGSMNPEQAKQGFLGLAGLVIAIGLVIAAFGLLVKGDAAKNIDKFGKTMTKLAIAFLLMTLVTKALGGMDQATLIQGGIAIAAFAGIMVGLMAATKLISGSKNVETIGKTLLKIALAIGVMALVAKMLGGMEPDELVQGGTAIVAFGGIIVGLMAATKLINGSKNVDKIGSTLFKISLAIGVMALVASMLGKMEPATLIKGGIAITAFAGIIVGLMAATKLISGSKNIDKIGGAILAVSGAIAIMALTAFMLSMVSWEGFAKGTIMVTAFAGIIVGLIAATKLVGKDADEIGKTIITIAAAIGILGVIAVLLSLVPVENMKRGLIIVGALSAIMAVLIAVTKLANEKTMGLVIAIAGTIAVLGGIVYLLSTIPAESVMTSAIALGGLLIVMTGVLTILGLIGKKWKNALLGVLALTAMAVPLLAFVGVLALMQNVQNALTNVQALTILAAAMTLLLIPLTIVGKFAANALLGVLALTAMAVPLLAFVGIIALIQNIQNALVNIQTLTILAAAMTLLLIPLTLIGTFAASALLGVLALTAMAVPLLAFVGILALMQNVQNGITNTMALTMLITAIGDVLFKISLVAPLAVLAVRAITTLVGVITVFGVLATAIGVLVTQFPQLQTFLDTGIPILVQMASGLGQAIGAFITGFAGEVMTLLPQLGLCLSMFMTNAMPFITGAKLVDESVLAGVGILAGAVLALTAADLIAGVTSFLSGGSSFADLGTQLSMFMTNAMPFITAASMITPEMMSGVKALADTILILTAANVLEGLTSWLTGGSSLETFAAQLPILGQGLAAFSASLGSFTEDQLATVNCAAQAVKTLASAAAEIPNTGGLLASIVGDNDLGVFAAQFPILGSGLALFLSSVGTFTEEQVATVNCAAQAIKSLAQASSEIPNSGGWLGQIVGENDLGTFAAQFPVLGTGLRGFLDNVGTFTDEQVATVDCAAKAIKTLAQASSEIPNSGGWLGQIVGENDLGTFAAQFPKLGTGLADFLTNVGTFTDEQAATVNCAANAVKTLASVAQTIPNTGGLIAELVGDNDLGDFASKFPQVGAGIKGFTDELGTFNAAKVDTVNAGISAIRAIATLANTDLSGLTANLEEFGLEIHSFGGRIASFCEKLPGKDSLDGAITQVNTLVGMVRKIASINSGPLATFAENLEKISEKAVKKFVNAFKSDAAKTDLEKAAKALGDKVVDGIEAKEKAIETAGEDAAKKAVSGVRDKYGSMKSAGKYLVEGFAAGITEKTWHAEAKAKAMANAAEKAAKEALDINSPSKVFRAIGYSVPEGFAMGIDRMGNMVTDSSADMARNAIDNVSSSISRISDLVSSDIDAQPTIRPVLDLSDVKSGASAIGSMLDMGSSIGVRANIGAITSMMSTRGQNGTNADIVSAIDKLNKKMDNMGNTTNNIINGVTYDDGSNINDAVATLVRAARIERRV